MKCQTNVESRIRSGASTSIRYTFLGVDSLAPRLRAGGTDDYLIHEGSTFWLHVALAPLRET